MVAVNALNVMREGHDGSGVGLFMRDLGGPFEKIKNAPMSAKSGASLTQ